MGGTYLQHFSLVGNSSRAQRSMNLPLPARALAFGEVTQHAPQSISGHQTQPSWVGSERNLQGQYSAAVRSV